MRAHRTRPAASRCPLGVALGVALTFIAGQAGCSPPSRGPTQANPAASVGTAPAPDPGATVAPLRLWLRDAAVLDAPAGRELFRSSTPTLVELGPDGRVASLPGATPAFVGVLPEEVLRAPSDLRGLGLYAQRIGELRLGSMSGPVIGRIFPGAYVGVASLTPPTAVIVVPVFESPGGGPILAHLDSSVLGPDPVALLEPPPVGRAARDIRRGLSAEPEGDRFSHAVCGELRILADRPHSNGRGDFSSQVAQRRDGVEIVAWTDQGIVGNRGDARCPSRFVRRDGSRLVLQDGPRHREVAVAAAPADFAAVPSAGEDALATILRGHGSLYWLAESSGALECVEWKSDAALSFGHDRSTSFEGHIERRVVEGHDAIIHRYTLSYGPSAVPGGTGQLLLLGPHTEVQGLRGPSARSGLSLACAESYITMTSEDGSVIALPGQSRGPVVAYHPADAERWYPSRAACEAALGRARSTPEPGTRTGLGLGLHRGC